MSIRNDGVLKSLTRVSDADGRIIVLNSSSADVIKVLVIMECIILVNS